MNSLSIIIFLIGMVENLTSYIVFAKMLSGNVFMIALFVYGLSHAIAVSVVNDSHGGKLDYSEWLPAIKQVLKISAIVWCISALFNVFAIDRKYMIMIAASEVGGRVIQSQAVQDAAGALSGLSGETTELLSSYIQVETQKLKKELAAEMGIKDEKPKDDQK